MELSPYYGRYGHDHHDPHRRQHDPYDPFSVGFPEMIFPEFPEFPIMRPPPFFIPPLPHEISTFPRTKIEHKETPEAHHFTAELPGLRMEEVEVHVEDGKVLHIRGCKSVEKKECKDEFHRYERSHGEFASRFRLPENAKPEHMKSHMDNGVLRVIVPKEKRGR